VPLAAEPGLDDLPPAAGAEGGDRRERLDLAEADVALAGEGEQFDKRIAE
jgi:hypothetical protein